MNDLDLVRGLLDEVPPPSAQRLAAGRARLLAAATAAPARRAHRRDEQRRPGMQLGFALAATAAAGLAAALLIPGLRPDGGGTIAASLAAKVLDTAAQTVASAPATAEPGPHQWFYIRSVNVQTGTATQYNEEWMTFDGNQDADYSTCPPAKPGGMWSCTQSGRIAVHTWHGAPLIPPGTGALAAVDEHFTLQTGYNGIAALPAGPSGLLAAVDAELAAHDAGQTYFGVSGMARTRPEREFAWLTAVLWNTQAGAPPTALANVYRAIATIPGVTVDERATDADGRPAIGVTDNNGAFELLLSPNTYRPVGIIERTGTTRIVKPSPGVSLSSTGPPSSPYPLVTYTNPPSTESIANIQVTAVSAPGER